MIIIIWIFCCINQHFGCYVTKMIEFGELDCRFVWDEAKYPTMSPLREIVDGIHVQIAKIEDDLKVCVLWNPFCEVNGLLGILSIWGCASDLLRGLVLS